MCDLKKFSFPIHSFKSCVGTAACRGQGFNCFQEDACPIHVDAEFGQCRLNIYCGHWQAAQIIFFAASGEVNDACNSAGQRSQLSPDTQGAINKILSHVRESRTLLCE